VERRCCAGNAVSDYKVFHRLSLVDWTGIVKCPGPFRSSSVEAFLTSRILDSVAAPAEKACKKGV
jgi:hypothetical protein